MNIYVIGALLAAVALISGWAFVASHLRYGWKMILASTLVAMSISAWVGTVGLLGYPVKGMPHDGAAILSIYIDKPNGIYFWAQDPNEKQPRNYVVPYSDDLAKKMLEAMGRAAAAGGRMILHLDVSGGTGRGNVDDGEHHVQVDVVPAIPDKS